MEDPARHLDKPNTFGCSPFIVFEASA